MVDYDPKVIDANPTKTLFIHMLVKDIPLTRAILDLVDNSVDGARRLRADNHYDGLWVRVEVTDKHLRIADNCGGIPVDIARHYAFRFGRPEGMQPTLRSVGQFGVGMKRAFFKIGDRFRVESTTEGARFVIEEDVTEWKKKDKWEFEFAELREGLHDTPPESRGTTITVTFLHKNVSDNFRLDNFKTRLAAELGTAHETSISRGLAISFNGIPLQARPLVLLHSDQLKAAYREEIYGGKGEAPVKVRIYAGLDASEPMDAGWYVYCNGRMVLEHDKTGTTGWGEDGEKAVARYHNQYARFRGFAFFDSDDAGRLPWNTTKTGVDADSPMYQAVRLKMVEMMRPVIAFLNKLKEERAQGEEDAESASLRAVIQAAQTSRLDEVTTSPRFTAPNPVAQPRPPASGRIQYSKPVNEIQRVMRALRVDSYKEAGEKTFEYFLKTECED